MIYKDRPTLAGDLPESLLIIKKDEPVVFALPRGGVVVAAEIAKALNAPLDLVLVRKIGAPFQPELAMGAVVDGSHPHVIRNEDIILSIGISTELSSRSATRSFPKSSAAESSIWPAGLAPTSRIALSSLSMMGLPPARPPAPRWRRSASETQVAGACRACRANQHARGAERVD